MSNYAIITDLNRCTGCLACTVACKAINGVDVGNFWIKTLRVGPHPIEGGSGTFPDVEMYFPLDRPPFSECIQNQVDGILHPHVRADLTDLVLFYRYVDDVRRHIARVKMEK